MSGERRQPTRSNEPRESESRARPAGSLDESTILAQIRGGLTGADLSENDRRRSTSLYRSCELRRRRSSTLEDERSDGYGHNMAIGGRLTCDRRSREQTAASNRLSSLPHHQPSAKARVPSTICGRRLRDIFLDRRCGHPTSGRDSYMCAVAVTAAGGV
jgi:hypothetical protein